MSFADVLREELSSVSYKKNCCRRAMTSGLLLGAECLEKKAVRVSFGNALAARVGAEMISAQFGKDADSETSGRCGHRYWHLQFAAPAAHKLVEQLASRDADVERILACDNCLSCFLRGAFIAYGTVSDPQKSFHLEFLLPQGRGSAALYAVLEHAGYPPKRVERAKGEGLYYKDSGAIEELITLMGAHHLVFDIINQRIEREIRNNENRATNCVAKNIEKSISAAARQMDAINQLMEKGRFDSLPAELRQTALLRYQNPDAALDELARLHSPVISKSGLNHRLQRLLLAAEEC